MLLWSVLPNTLLKIHLEKSFMWTKSLLIQYLVALCPLIDLGGSVVLQEKSTKCLLATFLLHLLSIDRVS